MASKQYGVKLKDVVEKFGLNVTHASTEFDSIQIHVEEVSRPGLQLSGFFDHFERARLHVIGNVESAYLNTLSHEQLLSAFEALFSYKIPALIFARGIEPKSECLEMAKKHDVTVLSSEESTSYVVSTLITYLKDALAPRITRHGVLVEVYGEGLLLMGESGIGKSETAVELLKRGHRLIADDAVELRKNINNTLLGTSPATIRDYIEIRGIGVINVAKLFGMASIKRETVVDLVINIVPWSDGYTYDRLGLENHYVDLLGVQVPSLTIPVKPGRNVAVILEVAAMNNRQKKMGYNAAVEFMEQIDRCFAEQKNS